MSYNYITKFDSPNYTPGSSSSAVFGFPRTIEGITIHWWGDPNKNPQFDNVVNYLCRSGGNTSAHFVATGTGRKVACIVSPANVAWHSGSAWGNAKTIGIELDPRARDEDYDVAAELIADIRSAYGDVPIYWHNYFIATACPGVWDPYRLDALSYTKYSHDVAWGAGGNIVQQPTPEPVTPPPVEEPKPLPVTLVRTTSFEAPKSFSITSPITLVNIPDGSIYKQEVYESGRVINDIVELQEYSDGSSFYRTKYARDNAKKNYGFSSSSLKEIVPSEPDPVVAIPSPTTKDPETGEPLPDTGKDVTEKEDYSEENNNMLKQILKIVTDLFDAFKSIFKIK